MSIDLELAEKLVAGLNDAMSHDSLACLALVDHLVPCGKAMATHPTIQVVLCDEHDDAVYRVGILGVLNGIVGAYDRGPRKGYGAIVADVDEVGGLLGFRILENV